MFSLTHYPYYHTRATVPFGDEFSFEVGLIRTNYVTAVVFKPTEYPMHWCIGSLQVGLFNSLDYIIN